MAVAMPLNAPNTTPRPPAPKLTVVRVVVFVLTLLETAAFLYLVYGGLVGGRETAGWIEGALALTAAFPFVLLVVPAVVLALMNRFMWFALMLSLAPVILVVVLFTWPKLAGARCGI